MAPNEAAATWDWSGRLVRLRELREDDLPDLVEWLNLPEVASTQTTGPLHPKPRADAGAVFTNFSTNQGANIGLSVVRQEDDALVGHLMLYGVDPKDRCGTISILIGPPHQRAGLGRDALELLVRYAFTELGLHRLELSVNAFNAAGLALYRSLGFIEEGRRREAIYRAGAWHDHVAMGLLSSEWTRRSLNR
jgi:RimJ/RimL family protein N-acetyltransferase